MQEMLSEFLTTLGFNAMAHDVLQETEMDRLRRYARVILNTLPSDKKRDVLIRFKMLRLA